MFHKNLRWNLKGRRKLLPKTIVTDDGMSGRRGKYYCVPGCGSAKYDKHMNKTKVGSLDQGIKKPKKGRCT